MLHKAGKADLDVQLGAGVRTLVVKIRGRSGRRCETAVTATVGIGFFDPRQATIAHSNTSDTTTHEYEARQTEAM